jgi:hypothetical protein
MKDWIAVLIQFIAEVNCCRSAPVLGCDMFRRPWMRRGSNLDPAEYINLPHQRTATENRTHFPGCNFRLCSRHSVKNNRRCSKRLAMEDACRRRSSNQEKRCSATGPNASCKTDCECVTALVVPWRTRVGEYTPSGVMKYWHFWDSGASGSWQYPWLRSNVEN